MRKHLLRKTIFILLISWISSIPANAGAQVFPAILIENDNSGEHTPLPMTELNIDVRVVANIATTTMSMTFYNNINRVLEGSFYFPLGEGQTVSRFAITVNGRLREGVVVEKTKGRQVFESIVRQKIDPGLLEWTKGNNFKARVYPIPVQGYKKIVIAFEQELKDIGKGFLYTLPLNFKDRVDRFSVKAEVFKQSISPVLYQNSIEVLKFKKWSESYIAEAELKEYVPDRQLSFELPKEKDLQRIFIEKDPDNTGRSYFYISVDPKKITAPKTLPRKVCLIWDASGSTASRDIEKELTVLEGYFKKLKAPEVHVVILSNEIVSETDFSIKNGKIKKLSDFLRNIPYDGGTQLGALDFTRYRYDEFILSSDGLSNFGEQEIRLSKTPVITLNSNQSADHSYLRYIALATGGRYINLNKLTLEQAVESLSSQSYSFISATFDKGSIKEAYPRITTPVDKVFSMSGILLKDKAEITLNFGFGENPEYSRKIILKKSKYSSDTGLIKKMWARKKISELDMLYEKNREELTALGKEMNIVTRNTSLIVLDRLEDYIMHRIVPPEDMRKQYYEYLNREDSKKKKAEKSHIEAVIKKFKEQIRWWNTGFPVKNNNKKPEFSLPGEITQNRARARRHDDEDFVLEEITVTAERREAELQKVPMDMSVVRSDDMARLGIRSVDEIDEILPGSGPDSEKKSKEGRPGPAITLKKWNPETPYLTELRQTHEKEYYEVYLRLKKDYKDSSAFFLDVADFFAEKKDNKLALRVLSGIAEMELENHQLLRILGYRLMQLGYYKYAISVFKDVLKIREEEPQSYRDLALAYSADRQYQKTVDMLYYIVTKPWDDRFPDIELIALHEMNSIIAGSNERPVTDKIDKRLLKNLPVDVRVVLTWDADNTDMDLWVIDPDREKCFYSHPMTRIGGMMSGDYTQGYGPEEFMLKRAKQGKYYIKVNYYGNRQQILSGATTIQAVLFTNFGRPDEKQKAITLRLKDVKEVIDVGEFVFE